MINCVFGLSATGSALVAAKWESLSFPKAIIVRHLIGLAYNYDLNIQMERWSLAPILRRIGRPLADDLRLLSESLTTGSTNRIN